MLDRTYHRILLTSDEMADAQNRTRESLADANRHVLELKKKWEQHKELDQMEIKMDKLQIKYAWALYLEKKAEYDEAYEKMMVFQERAKIKQDELTQQEASQVDPAEEKRKVAERMEALTEAAREQAALKQQYDQQLKDQLMPYKALERQEGQMKKTLRDAQQNLQTAKKRLQAVRDEVRAHDQESEEARRTEALQKAEDELAQAREQTDVLTQAVADANRAYEEVEPQVQNATQLRKQAEKQLYGVEKNLQNLEHSSQDKMAVFGHRVSKVKGLVERAKRQFRGPVLGPLGAYLKMAPGKEAFAGVAELAIGSNSMDRFIVTNDHDRALFQKIRLEAGCQQDCAIYQVAQGARYNIPAPPADGIETVASVLQITEDLVFNALVDNSRIDQRAIGRSKEETERALLIKQGGVNRIRGIINEVYFLPQGDHWSVSKAGHISMVSNEKNLRTTIGVDRSGAIASAKREAEQYKRELKEHKDAEARLENQHTKLQRAWSAAKKAMSENDTCIMRLTEEIDKIRSEIETSATRTFDTTEYEEDVAQAEEQLESLKEKEARIREEKDEKEPAIQEIRARLDEIEVRNDKVLQDLKAAEDAMTQLLNTQTQREHRLEKARRKVAQYNELCEKHQQKVDEVKSVADGLLLTARTVHYRFDAAEKSRNEGSNPETAVKKEPTAEDLEEIEIPELNKTPADYESKIRREKKKLEEERSRRKLSTEDPTVAFEKYERAKTDLASKLSQITELDTKLTELSRDLRKRERKFSKFQETLTEKTNSKFSTLLGLNKYCGQLEFDHENSKLDLNVQKEGAAHQSQTKDVKALRYVSE